MIERLNISKRLRRAVIHQSLLIILSQRVTILNGITLIYQQPGRSDLHCKIKETLLIPELQPALNENVGSEKLLYLLGFVLFCRFQTEVCLFIYFFIFLFRYQSFTLRLNLFVIFPTVTSDDVC